MPRQEEQSFLEELDGYFSLARTGLDLAQRYHDYTERGGRRDRDRERDEDEGWVYQARRTAREHERRIEETESELREVRRREEEERRRRYW